MQKDFEAYAIGIFTASICTSLSIESAIEKMNKENPTCIGSQWSLSQDKTFKTGEPNPCPCNSAPDTHKHFLLDC